MDTASFAAGADPTGFMAFVSSRVGRETEALIAATFQRRRAEVNAQVIDEILSTHFSDASGRNQFPKEVIQFAKTTDNPLAAHVIFLYATQQSLIEEKLVQAAGNAASVEALKSETHAAINEIEDHYKRQRDILKGLLTSVNSTNADLKAFAEQTRFRMARSGEDNHLSLASIASVRKDVDLLKELAWGTMTPTQQVQAIEDGHFSINDPDERRRIELRAKVYETKSKINETLSNTRQLIEFAGHVGLDDETKASLSESLQRFEVFNQAASILAAGTVSPFGYVAATNLLFTAISMNSGNVSAQQEVMRALDSVKTEIRASTRTIVGEIGEFQEEVYRRLQDNAHNQIAIEEDMAFLELGHRDLVLDVKAVSDQIEKLSERQREFERNALLSLKRIEFGIAAMLEDRDGTERDDMSRLSKFCNDALQKWPGGMPYSLTEAADFLAEDSKRYLAYLEDGSKFLDRHLLRIPNREHISPFFLHQTKANLSLLSEDEVNLGDLHGLFDEVARPAMAFLHYIYNKDLAKTDGEILWNARCAKLFDVCNNTEQVYHDLEARPSQEAGGEVRLGIDLQNDCKHLLSARALIDVAQNLIVIAPWYEIVDSYQDPRGVISAEELSKQGRSNIIGYELLLEMKRLLDIAIMQHGVMEGGAFMQEMVQVLLQHSSDAKALELRFRLAAREAEIKVLQKKLEQNNLVYGDRPQPADGDDTTGKSRKESRQKLVEEAMREEIGTYRELREKQLESLDRSECRRVINTELTFALPGYDLFQRAAGENPLFDLETEKRAWDQIQSQFNPNDNVRESKDRILKYYRRLRNLMDEQAVTAAQKLSQKKLINAIEQRYQPAEKRIAEINLEIARLKDQIGNYSPAADKGNEDVTGFILLQQALRSNDLLRQNFAVFLVRELLKRHGKNPLQYRLAYGTSQPDTVLALLGLDAKIFRVEELRHDPVANRVFSTSKWGLVFPQSSNDPPFILTLPPPLSVASGLIEHTREYYELFDMRNQIEMELIDILVGCKL